MKLLKLVLCLFIFPIAAFSQTQPQQQQLNLDDIEIKGEANSLKGLGISARKKNDLSGRIQLKSDFTSDILEELPENFKLPAASQATPSKKDR